MGIDGDGLLNLDNKWKSNFEFLPSAAKLRQGNIFSGVCQSFCSGGGGEVCLPQCMLVYTTSLAGTPPLAGTPQQVHPLWTGAPPGRYTPSRAGTPPPGLVHPPGRSLHCTLLDVKLANENPTTLSTLDHVMQLSHYNDLFHVLIR